MGQGSSAWQSGPSSAADRPGWLDEAWCSCREPLDWVAAEERIDSDRVERTDAEDRPGAVRKPLQGTAPVFGGSRPSLFPEGVDRMSTERTVANKRLRRAVEKVKAVNRIAKSVRIGEETVVCFEVASQSSADADGFVIGDKVIWSDADDDVPKGSVGEVIGMSGGGIIQVRFPSGTWDFRAVELAHQDTWSTKLARSAIKEAEKHMRELQVLEAETVLAEAAARLEECVALEKFEPDSWIADKDGTISSGPAVVLGSKTAHTAAAPRLQRGNSNNGLATGSRSPGTRRASLLSVAEAREARAAIARMSETQIYRDVCQRAGQYHAVARALTLSPGFRLAWENAGDQLWVHMPSGVSWFEYRMVVDFGSANVKTCVAACSGEPDLALIPSSRMQDGRAFIGAVHPSKVVVWCNFNAILCRVDLMLERFRWYNTEFGCFAESIRSSFPVSDERHPKKSLSSLSRRVVVNAQHLWIPRGGGESGTIAAMLVRIDFGSRLARWVLSNSIRRAAPGLVDELKTAVSRSTENGAGHLARISDDRYGLYARLSKVEAAAANRPPVSVSELPNADVLKKAYHLPSSWP